MPKSQEEKIVIDIVKKIIPSVVSISIVKNIEDHLEGEYSPFNFFHLPEKNMTHKHRVHIGGGSGFFISKDGLILTNRHVVVDPNAEYTVITSRNQKYRARVLARDEINDIAIIKIKENGFIPLEMGDSYSLKLGQTVLAIGNALGQFQNTVSKGVISGLARYIFAATAPDEEMQNLRGLIQTDAAINPGNSGGPLIDLDGKVIGINAAIVWGAQNIGFSIPINNAKKDLNDLIKYGRIRQPFLGVRYIQITKDIQELKKIAVNYGALILKEHLPHDLAIVKESPADKAGIKEGDIILEYNGKKITEKDTLQDFIQKSQVGDTITLKILRGMKERVLKTVLGERNPSPQKH
ncbi:hypothetical protein A2907_02760 [Candidatus Azambacteria bacterium RIFCSPLOWO2_01_FULL_37_9]|uniref:PDZ domain-containing protein n=1 Tax=Candidatus Azambacteria bacterium RIFCSPLOWO2_01_FULL_37_9 TaxID=1797297 RepID=A0A1F5C6H1_9BACT|nr:MAG: hypothetical protein A2907_02760 [Candidatus Azambacteria bacterium RIFCSPLOWO2_01_FULL_37_9]